MKQKIHIPLSPDNYRDELVSESHFQIPKLTHLLIFSFFFLLCSFFSNAQQTQPYEWEWAMSGGSSKGGLSDEAIHDIKVGSDGNYYFIASIFGTGQHNNAQLDGLTVPTNNIPSGPEDIFLFSTDCEGDVRWSQAIGGGSSDRAYNLVLDSEDNVYIGGYFSPGVTNSAGTFPVRFSATDSLPTNSNDPDYHKKIFLVKYDKDGNYQGKKALQGNVQGALDSGALILDLAISNDTLHSVVCLLSGTQLDNQVTVPSQYVYDPATAHHNYQYHLVKYDTDFNYINSMVLPITLDNGNGIPNSTTRFAYDRNNNTYYLAGEKNDALLMEYGGDYIVNRAYIIAIDGNDGSKKWIREIYSTSTSSSLTANSIRALTVDNNSNVYVGGSFHQRVSPSIKIYDPADTSVSPYFFTAGVSTTIPMIIQFNSAGDVQWAQATAHIQHIAPGPRYGKGIAINNIEVALGAQAGADTWGNIQINLPVNNYQPDPTLIRFDKQSGTVLEVHGIEGDAASTKRMTAVAADNDGNYIAGGSFETNLFMNNSLGINL